MLNYCKQSHKHSLNLATCPRTGLQRVCVVWIQLLNFGVMPPVHRNVSVKRKLRKLLCGDSLQRTLYKRAKSFSSSAFC